MWSTTGECPRAPTISPTYKQNLSLSPFVKCRLFVDDTELDRVRQNLILLYTMLPIGWEQINLLLSVSKSNLLLFNVGNQPQTEFEFFIDHDEQLKQKEYAKYLGVFIDNKLSWKKHIQTINLKAKE